MAPMFVPGPVDVAPEVLAAQAKPMMPHRSKDFEAIFRRTEEKAKQLFFTQYRIFQGTHSGSGMQEAGVRNLAASTVLSLHQRSVLQTLVRCGGGQRQAGR